MLAASRRSALAPARRTLIAATRRGARQLRAEAPFAIVLAVIAAAFLYLLAAPEHWRRGSIVIAAGLVLAGTFRLVLGTPTAGLLAVRGRWFDVAAYLTAGVAIVVTAVVVA